MEVVAYYRVSTKSQGESGLGLDAQRQYIEAAAEANGWIIEAEYTDTAVSGTTHPLERPECSKAFSHGLCVVVAKLDRLSRDVAHIATLMKTAKFIVATMPTANTMQLHLFAMLAEQEVTFIRERTKAALQALKEKAENGDAASQAKVANRSVALSKGRTKANQAKGGDATKAKAESFAASIKDNIELCILKGRNAGGITLQGVANCLNEKGITTAKGGTWSPVQVSRVMQRLSLSF